MYSKVNSYQWNWVKWGLCSDAPISKDNSAYWNVSLETDEGGMITDYKGNALRVTRYGSNWGVAYAAKPSFLKNDTTNSPTSLFTVNKDLLNWVRYTAGNLGKTEQYCPAGNKSLIHKRVKRDLPSSFQLTDEWIRRLYAIATSVSVESATRVIGVCGPCALHSFQMLAELQEYHSQGPLQSGGYFFDTAPDTDPFISFGRRYPHLERLLEDIPIKYSPYPHYYTQRFLSFASINTMLPQYFWSTSTESTNRAEILSHISSLINSPPGSIWLGVMGRQRPDGTIAGHMVPIFRASQGLVVIPTNARSWTLEQFRRALVPTTDLSQIVAHLEEPNTLTRFTTIQPLGIYTSMFESMMSNANCTGEGDGRRGTGEYPTSASVNQCPSGRCALPLPF
ncbi:PF07598 family protein [Leptospira weilii serovar Ranarum str. ICFT]|uniref:PF07598 family protein n=1 Tax=Leptospira weilii serovar Ranarum str. ICFT TaxID=1218598 RepID=N1WAL0_9LEPT|nr:PF07598 family protein [Leptospira weilii serovar Ranarum str. ICFT]